MPQTRSAKASASPSSRKAKSIPSVGTQASSSVGITPPATAGRKLANQAVGRAAATAGTNRAAAPGPDPGVLETLSAKAFLVAGRGDAAAPPRASDEARDGAELRRGPIREVERHLVDVAPAPALGRVVAFDDRMPGGVEVRGRMLVGRAVAAAHVAAGAADAQVHPPGAGLQAILASLGAGRHGPHRIEVGAGPGHQSSTSTSGRSSPGAIS